MQFYDNICKDSTIHHEQPILILENLNKIVLNLLKSMVYFILYSSCIRQTAEHFAVSAESSCALSRTEVNQIGRSLEQVDIKAVTALSP